MIQEKDAVSAAADAAPAPAPPPSPCRNPSSLKTAFPWQIVAQKLGGRHTDRHAKDRWLCLCRKGGVVIIIIFISIIITVIIITIIIIIITATITAITKTILTLAQER